MYNAQHATCNYMKFEMQLQLKHPFNMQRWNVAPLYLFLYSSLFMFIASSILSQCSDQGYIPPRSTQSSVVACVFSSAMLCCIILTTQPLLRRCRMATHSPTHSLTIARPSPHLSLSKPPRWDRKGQGCGRIPGRTAGLGHGRRSGSGSSSPTRTWPCSGASGAWLA